MYNIVEFLLGMLNNARDECFFKKHSQIVVKIKFF